MSRRPARHLLVGLVSAVVLGGLVASTLPAAHATVTSSSVPAATSPDAVAERATGRPNIVLVLVDDMRADDLRWMPATRRLLAHQGVSFANAVSPHPLCCPARAELLTGQYAQNNGVQHNQGKHGGYPALRTGSTIATWMHGQGYQTGFIGKHLNRYQEFDRRDPGWDYFKPLTNNVYGYEGFAFHGERGKRGYVTDAIADRTRQAITRFSRKRKPFLLMVNHVAPHARVSAEREMPPLPAAKYRNAFAGARSPSFADPAFNERDLRDKVGAARHRHRVPKSKVRTWFLARIRSLASVDDAVASAVRTLRARGELDNTYVAFTSDNGMALGEHRYFGKNELTDEILRVPLLMRGPGIDAGAVDERIVTLVDLTATFLDLADVKPRLKIDGRSVAAPGSRDTTLVQTGRTMLHRDFAKGWAARGVLTDRYLYSIDPRRRADDVLYDRLRDPHELRNVADKAAYAAIRRELRSRTEVLGRCAGARCNRRFGALPEPRG